jgi:pimeloyl-ACP methyl ester carboxylesterase
LERVTLPHEPPLILLSGMGADERLFRYQKATFPNLIVPSWIEPNTNESLSDYAERLARLADPGVPCFVGGVSFGGIVALEMVPHLQAMACFLIGSIRSPEQLPWPMRMFRPLSRLTPDQLAQLTALCLRLSKPSLPRRADRQLGRYAEPNANFLRWASLSVWAWKPQRSATTPVYHIHGELDRTLPVRMTTPDVIVRGGDHMLPWTCPEQVNAFLRERMQSSLLRQQCGS